MSELVVHNHVVWSGRIGEALATQPRTFTGTAPGVASACVKGSLKTEIIRLAVSTLNTGDELTIL